MYHRAAVCEGVMNMNIRQLRATIISNCKANNYGYTQLWQIGPKPSILYQKEEEEEEEKKKKKMKQNKEEEIKNIFKEIQEIQQNYTPTNFVDLVRKERQVIQFLSEQEQQQQQKSKYGVLESVGKSVSGKAFEVGNGAYIKTYSLNTKRSSKQLKQQANSQVSIRLFYCFLHSNFRQANKQQQQFQYTPMIENQQEKDDKKEEEEVKEKEEEENEDKEDDEEEEEQKDVNTDLKKKMKQKEKNEKKKIKKNKLKEKIIYAPQTFIKNPINYSQHDMHMVNGITRPATEPRELESNEQLIKKILGKQLNEQIIEQQEDEEQKIDDIENENDIERVNNNNNNNKKSIYAYGYNLRTDEIAEYDPDANGKVQWSDWDQASYLDLLKKLSAKLLYLAIETISIIPMKQDASREKQIIIEHAEAICSTIAGLPSYIHEKWYLERLTKSRNGQNKQQQQQQKQRPTKPNKRQKTLFQKEMLDDDDNDNEEEEKKKKDEEEEDEEEEEQIEDESEEEENEKFEFKKRKDKRTNLQRKIVMMQNNDNED
ncbi:MAG: hypothetical protein EZS28_027395, partial [Streblomastix strix]